MTFSLHQGGVVMSSKIHKRTIINIQTLAHILDTWALILSSCAIFTVYPTPLQLIATRTREGSAKEHRDKQKWLRETQSFTYAP